MVYPLLLITPSLLLGLALGLVVPALARRLRARSQTPPPPSGWPLATKLEREARLLSMSPWERAATVLTSLDEATGWKVYKLLEPAHAELVVTEIPSLDSLDERTREQMWENLAESLELPREGLEAHLARQPDLVARVLSYLLPMTDRQFLSALEPSHRIPDFFGSSSDLEPRRTVVNLWGELPRPSEIWDLDDDD